MGTGLVVKSINGSQLPQNEKVDFLHVRAIKSIGLKQLIYLFFNKNYDYYE